jgi:virginiamycin A acetyltransferase
MTLSLRIREAKSRYGWRAFTIAFYRTFCSWPNFKSTLKKLKIELLLNSEIGSAVRFGKDIFFMVPGGFLAIGDCTYIGDRCFLEVWPNPRAEIKIGSNCYFAHDIHFSAFQEITIGNDVRVAEFCSLRDTSHNYKDRSRNINQQGDTIGRLIIHDDVWIGQGCIVLGSPEGTVIGRGAVIGAHSVVKESIPEFAIVAGAPAKIIKYRE